ncbi:hypothetical protein D9M72_544000 [compost metagenome]
MGEIGCIFQYHLVVCRDGTGRLGLQDVGTGQGLNALKASPPDVDGQFECIVFALGDLLGAHLGGTAKRNWWALRRQRSLKKYQFL